MNYRKNNKGLIEQALDETIRQMCVLLKIGLADWDIDDRFRQALQKQDKIKELAKNYDETYEIMIKTKTKINDKYKYLYKLWQ